MLGITKYQLNNSGYEIYTNLDVNLQKAYMKMQIICNFSRVTMFKAYKSW